MQEKLENVSCWYKDASQTKVIKTYKKDERKDPILI